MRNLLPPPVELAPPNQTIPTSFCMPLFGGFAQFATLAVSIMPTAESSLFIIKPFACKVAFSIGHGCSGRVVRTAS